MGVRNVDDYKKTIASYDTEVYFQGERINDVANHPCVKPIVESIGATFDIDRLAIPKELAYVAAPIEGTINRHNHLIETADDAVKRVKLVRELSFKTGACTHRCVGIDAVNTLDVMTRKIDRECNTEYHSRFSAFMHKVKMEDWVLAASMTDGKGDRSKKPKEQSDSDLFLRIIAKSEKGIVVRGAKVHQGRPMAVDWMLVLPGTGLGPDEADHAVVFAVRPDTPGLSMVMSQGPAELFRMQADQEDLGNPQYGLHIGNLLIFNEVFIPWEHVFLCGEYQYVGELVDIFCRYHRMATGGCKAGLCDLIATLGAMIAEMNGLAKASHIKDKLIDIIKLGETSYGCAIAAATLGEKTSDGNFIPNAMQANITKLNAADAVNRSLALLQDIAGALVATLPSQKDLDSPTNGAFIRKYLASDGIGCEEKFKIFRLAQNLIFGAQGLVALHGGGSPQVQRMAVLFEANLQKKRTRARALAGINDTKGV